MTTSRQPAYVMFDYGPSLGLQRRIGLISDRELHVVRRAILIILIGWLPLIVLSLLQGIVLQTHNTIPLLWDMGVHARLLLAAPLLVIAEFECGKRLSAVVRQFIDAGLVPERERARFDTAVSSTRRLLDSNTIEIIVFALAYSISLTALLSLPIDEIPAWHRYSGLVPVYSMAGWWHALVSAPLFLILVLAWIWRLLLWTRLLWLIAQLDLRLVASHPDHAAGIGFLGISVRGFSIVAAAFATIVAGRSANIVMLGGALPTQYFIFNASLLAAIVVLFVAPLFVFTPKLTKTWREGTLKYGALSSGVGVAFEDKWIRRNESIDQAALDKPDFSATTDLYSITANVYTLRLVPIDIQSLTIFSGAMLLPFIPVVFLVVPLDQVAAGLKKLLF